MYVENEEKRKGWKPIIDQYRETIDYFLKYKFSLLFKEKVLLLFIIVDHLGRTYLCIDVRR